MKLYTQYFLYENIVGGKVFKTVTILSSFALVVSGAAGIAQEPRLDLDSPGQVVSRIAPEILFESNDQSTAKVVAGNADVTPYVSTISPLGGSSSSVTKVELLGAQGTPQERDGFLTFNTNSDATRIYAQPLGNGMRVMSIVENSEQESSFSYAFDVPEATTFEPLPDGGWAIILPENNEIIRLAAPWARDANGNDVPTEYKWNGAVLTQSMDLDLPGVKFSVLADPAWTYSLGFEVNNNKTPKMAWNAMHKCFNCTFPVENAPRGWPVFNQFLPLTANGGIMNMNCRMDASSFNVWNNKEYMEFSFLSAPGHVDGTGSSITFSIFTPNANKPGVRAILMVDAYIANDFGAPANALYVAFAKPMWQTFADNLGNV